MKWRFNSKPVTGGSSGDPKDALPVRGVNDQTYGVRRQPSSANR
jgi:hypothetical protein